MTESALTRPGERSRLSSKLAQYDWRFYGLLAAITGVGVAMLYSVAGQSWEPWAIDHITRFAVLSVVMLALGMLDLRWWYAIAYPLYGFGLLLLVAVELVGDVRLGAQRWLSVGPLSFQPSELMRIGIILALSRWYHGESAKQSRWSWRLLVPALMIMAPVFLIAKQPDLGTSLLVAFTGGTIVVLAGLNWRVIAAGAAAAVVAIPLAFEFVLHDYQRQRILTFLNPQEDPSGSGYHILQSMIAIGSGGVLGRGYGLGTQSQLSFLPEKQTDFIFSAFAEEFGLLGCLFVLLLYAAVIIVALRIAASSHSHFGRLAAAGATATFAFYIMVNGAMVMGLAPVVGVPMPLMSYGGTVMMTVMVAFGLVQSVRVHRYQEVTKSGAALL